MHEPAVDQGSAPILRMTKVSTRPDSEGPALDQVSLDIRSGEIIGVAGVEGNGQRTLVRAIAAMADVVDGNIINDNQNLTTAPLAARRSAGLRIIPFERNVEGLSLTSSLWENWAARSLLQNSLLSTISPSAIRKQCDTALKEWDVRYSEVGQRAGSLSGGNAQK